MSVFKFLNNRQYDTKYRKSSKLNLDHILTRLVCLQKDVYRVSDEESYVPPFTCKFRKDSQCDLLAVANEDGYIILYDTSDLASGIVVKSFMAHDNAIYDLCWLPNKCQMISCSGDFSAILWDMTQIKAISTFKKHTASVKSIDVCHENSAIFATGSRDGVINVWDIREARSVFNENSVINIHYAHCRKPVAMNRKRCTKKNPTSSFVSAVAFQNSNYLASAGVADGIIKIWDLRKTYITSSKHTPLPKYQMDYANSQSTAGCTSLVFDSSYKTLYACSTDNKICKFDCHSYNKYFSAYEGFKCATYFVKIALSSDDQYLLCGSSDDNAYIWKTCKPGLPILQLHGHKAEVTSVCWSPYDITKLATCSDDLSVAVWKITKTENVDPNLIEGVTEVFCKSQDKACSCYDGTIQNSSQLSTVLNMKSPEVQTSSRLANCVITNFFSHVTPAYPSQQQSNILLAENISINMSSKSQPSPEPSQILTPSNHINKIKLLGKSFNEVAENNSIPKQKLDFLNIACLIQNKENAKTKSNAENLSKVSNHKKRKIDSINPTSSLKKSWAERTHKSKSSLKNDSKYKPAGKTIMNYFSIVSYDE